MAKKNPGGKASGRKRLQKKTALKQKSVFVGKGLQKAPRRANGAAKGSRLWYATIRKDQYGTPMESMIKTYFGEICRQRNDPNYKGGVDYMHFNDAIGRLHTKWKGAYKRNLAPMIKKFITNRRIGARGAKKQVNNIFLISFGQDPKSR